jgi:hypothetical protein
VLRAPIAQRPHGFAGDVGRLLQGQTFGGMKRNQGVAFAHGERPSGAGVFVVGNSAGEEVTHGLRDRRDLRLAAPPVFKLFGKITVENDANRFADVGRCLVPVTST